MRLDRPFRLLLIAVALCVAEGANAAQPPTLDACQLYGFAPRTRDYAACRMNLRNYWTTGPCARSGFATIHRDYCHLNPPPFI